MPRRKRACCFLKIVSFPGSLGVECKVKDFMINDKEKKRNEKKPSPPGGSVQVTG